MAPAGPWASTRSPPTSSTTSITRVISGIFTDVIIAPEFEADARALLQKKKNLRLMKMNDGYLSAKKAAVIRSSPGGLMVMDRDHTALGLDDLENKVVTKRPPTEEELRAMRFGWRIVKNVKRTPTSADATARLSHLRRLVTR